MNIEEDWPIIPSVIGNAQNTGKPEKAQPLCSRCRQKIVPGKAYHHTTKVLCEECCLDLRTPRVRKTHWQYIGSIKADYLIPGKKR